MRPVVRPLAGLLAGPASAIIIAMVVATGAMAQEPPAADGTEPGTVGEPRAGTAPRPSADDTADPVSRPDNRRFGMVVDQAYGAFQRGLYVTALNLALPRAEAGDAAAQMLVAEIHARGLGVRLDPVKAIDWYRRAAEQGAPDAQFQYALALIEGEHVEADPDAAFVLMEDSANAGHVLAQFNFAQMLLARGRPTDIERAAAFFERAARTGLADAQYAMAQVYANGAAGRPQDMALARRWLEQAARQNYDTAQLELGTWLVEGVGGAAEPETGFAWLLAAARAGNVAAQNRVAKLYLSGVGTEGDPVEAAAWYELARRAGLADPLMEDFLLGLTDEQHEQAVSRTQSLR